MGALDAGEGALLETRSFSNALSSLSSAEMSGALSAGLGANLQCIGLRV